MTRKTISDLAFLASIPATIAAAAFVVLHDGPSDPAQALAGFITAAAGWVALRTDPNSQTEDH